jgi:hypothetical protein
VWVADGVELVRVLLTSSGGKQEVDKFSVPGVQAGEEIRAVRVSPDGVRVALVVGSPGRPGGQLLVGSIVRGSKVLRVDGLEVISPQKADITDVAWINSLRLFAIGRLAVSQDWRSFDTRVDGSVWSSRVVNLSSRPDYVTATADNLPWLSAGGFVWRQESDGTWGPPIGGQTPGTAPIYVE